MSDTVASAPQTGELEQKLSKYKEVVSKLKNALQAARAEVAQARADAQSAKAEAAAAGESQLERKPPAANGGFSIDAVQRSQETVSVVPLCLVSLPESQEGSQWVLAEAWAGSPPSSPVHPPLTAPGTADSASTPKPTDTPQQSTATSAGSLLTRGWVQLTQLSPYLAPGQDLPAPYLPPDTTAAMQAQVQAAQQRLAACEEAFRRFRVQAATTTRRLNEQIEASRSQGGEGGVSDQRVRSGTDASASSTEGAPLGPVLQHGSGAEAALADVKAELRLVRAELNRALSANGDSTARFETAEAALASVRKQLATSQDETEAWKLRCLEAEAALSGSGGATPGRRTAGAAGGDTPSEGAAAAAAAPAKAQLGKLQREFAKYREQALRLLTAKTETVKQLKARVAELEGGSQGPKHGINDVEDTLLTASGAEYLRNVLVQYMAASDEGMKRTLEATVATVMRFTPEEIRSIQDARDARNSALGMAGSMLGSIGSVFSGLGGSGARPPPPAPTATGSGDARASVPQDTAEHAEGSAGTQPLGGSSIMSALAQHEIR